MPKDAQSREEATLIFAWRRPGGVRRRLLACLAVSVFGHFFLFYLFKVVTPAYRRTAPPPRGLTFLPSTLPDAGRLARNLADRYPGANPFDELDQPDHEALKALVKDYEPSWKRHVAALKPWPSTSAPLSLLPEDGVVTPPPPAFEEEDEPPPARVEAGAEGKIPEEGHPASTLVVSVQSGLGDRRIVSGVQWPPAPFNEDWPESGVASFSLEVDPDGSVRSCLPWSPPAGMRPETLNLLLSALRTLRFSPAGREVPQWGLVEIQW